MSSGSLQCLIVHKLYVMAFTVPNLRGTAPKAVQAIHDFYAIYPKGRVHVHC